MPRPPLARRRWFDGVSAVILLLIGLPTGCNSTPVHRSDFSGRTPIVRVLLLQNRASVSLTGDAPPQARLLGDPSSRHVDLSPGTPVTLALSPGGWQIGGAVIASRAELTLLPEVEGSLRINGRSYRGRFRFVPRLGSNGQASFDVINDVDVENYLRGVVGGEMPATFAPAACAAQAVVARTYALYTVKMSSAGASPYDLFADERSQVYVGMGGETPQSLAAVDQTAGQVVAYGPPGDERIFKAYYSSCCGGIGQSATDAFGDAPIPPLDAQRRGNLCAASPSFNWPAIVVSKAELTSRFRHWGQAHRRPERDLMAVRRVDVAGSNLFGRPVRFKVTDSTGRQYMMSGEDLRTAVNTDAPAKLRLPSSLFRIQDTGPTIAFVDGHGRGHGVGLCQWCAQAQALQGMDYKQIVLSAYPSSVVLRAY